MSTLLNPLSNHANFVMPSPLRLAPHLSAHAMTSELDEGSVPNRHGPAPDGPAALTALTVLRRGAWLLAAFMVTGCAVVAPDASAEVLTSVDTWQLKMTPQGADQVRIVYTPPPSSQRQYPGANHQSDGKVLVVSLRSCLLHEECPTLLPAKSHAAAGKTRWFEVVVPYKGEQVVVDGDGPGSMVLSLTP